MVVVVVVQLIKNTPCLSRVVPMMQRITGQSPRESNSRATAPAPTSPDGRYQMSHSHVTLCPTKGTVRSTQNSDKENLFRERRETQKEPGLDDGRKDAKPPSP